MNRLAQTFNTTDSVLNIYFTAGYPELNDTVQIAKQLYKNGVDMIEIGMPFSDPLADGKTIQQSSEVALKNGITIQQIFDQVTEIRTALPTFPIILMGYLNQLLQFGMEGFLKTAKQAGVDALIIPDLPLEVYTSEYKDLFKAYGLNICFLITPETSTNRVIEIARECTGFLYMVSTFSTTGNTFILDDVCKEYFTRIDRLNLNIPKLVGFGIHNQSSFKATATYANGAIIGSAFINALNNPGTLSENINHFISSIRCSYN